MNEQESVVYSAYVGIDSADSKHDVCICPRDSDTRKFDVIRHRAVFAPVDKSDEGIEIPAYVKYFHVERSTGLMSVKAFRCK